MSHGCHAAERRGICPTGRAGRATLRGIRHRAARYLLLSRLPQQPRGGGSIGRKRVYFARRGVAPEYPQTDEGDRGPPYIPGEDHPLLVPTTGASGPRWGFDDLVWATGQAKDGAIPVLTFHGVPDEEHPWVNTDPGDFQRYMEYLKDGGYTVVALRDLREWVDLSRQSDDPYVPINRRLVL